MDHYIEDKGQNVKVKLEGAEKKTNFNDLKSGGFIKQKQKDLFAVRLRCPGGSIPTDKLVEISKIAQKYSKKGEIHLSYRQSLEILHVDYKDFEDWSGKGWKKRGEDYDALKDTIANGLIDLVDGKYPGFADLVEYVEVSTPLTVEHFTGHPKGAIYGLEASPERFREVPFGARTKIKGLYLTGADVFTIGIVPALVSGLMTAGALVGPFGFFKVLKDMAARRGG